MDADLWVAAFCFTLSAAAILVGAAVLAIRALFDWADRTVAAHIKAADATEWPERHPAMWREGER